VRAQGALRLPYGVAPILIGNDESEPGAVGCGVTVPSDAVPDGIWQGVTGAPF
jgi:hypothetical protein